MSFPTSNRVIPWALLSAVLLAGAGAACGGATSGDDHPTGGTGPSPNGTTTPADPGTPGSPGTPAKPPFPTGPYSGLVGTTDVSILYPLPTSGQSADFVRPTESGAHGVLLPKSAVDTVLQSLPLERTTSVPDSSYAALALVSLRLDPCSARGSGSIAGACRSEVRLVFQALYDKPAGAAEDPVAGKAATDGALHVIYDLPDSELVTMMKQILTLKKANGDRALQELAPHPILVAQGLGGAFAQGLRDIVLEHVGDDRIGRVTFFDHNFEPESDGWRFGVFDRKTAGAGQPLTPGSIPTVKMETELVAGSNTVGPLVQSSADGFSPPPADSVALLVSSGRPAPGSPTGTLESSLAAALRVENPTVHNAETTSCANCHLAEGARRIGESVYGLSTTNAFTHTRSLARKDERTSVTNLHAFGYLHRQVSIMQRTANESVLVADRMAQKVATAK
jgi:hypothetical protein